jgi:hypothetical protein
VVFTVTAAGLRTQSVTAGSSQSVKARPIWLADRGTSRGPLAAAAQLIGAFVE